MSEESFQALHDAQGFEQLLLGLQLERHVSGNRIGQPGSILDGRHRIQDLLGDLLVVLGVGFERGPHAAAECLDLHGVLGRFLQPLQLHQEMFRVRDEVEDSRPVVAFHQYLDRPVGEAKDLQNVGDRAHAVDIGFSRGVGFRFCLGRQEYLLVRSHRLFQRIHGLVSPDEEGYHHGGENDYVPQWKERHGKGIAVAFFCTGQFEHMTTHSPG